MTSDQDTKVVAEPQVQQVQEAKENSHLVSSSVVLCLFNSETQADVIADKVLVFGDKTQQLTDG